MSGYPYDVSERVECPRCHEQCGWCSDYRHMHGQLRLPGSRKRCKVGGMEPEGDRCPLCHGSRWVWRTISYTAAESPNAGQYSWRGGHMVMKDKA